MRATEHLAHIVAQTDLGPMVRLKPAACELAVRMALARSAPKTEAAVASQRTYGADSAMAGDLLGAQAEIALGWYFGVEVDDSGYGLGGQRLPYDLILPNGLTIECKGVSTKARQLLLGPDPGDAPEVDAIVVARQTDLPETFHLIGWATPARWYIRRARIDLGHGEQWGMPLKELSNIGEVCVIGCPECVRDAL